MIYIIILFDIYWRCRFSTLYLLYLLLFIWILKVFIIRFRRSVVFFAMDILSTNLSSDTVISKDLDYISFIILYLLFLLFFNIYLYFLYLFLFIRDIGYFGN